MSLTWISFTDEEWQKYLAKHAEYFRQPLASGEFDTLHKEPVSADYEREEELLENEYVPGDDGRM